MRTVRHPLDAHRLPLAALCVASILLTCPLAALAHARLVRSSPADQAGVATPLERIELWFSELLEDGFNSVEIVRAAEVTARQRTNLTRGAPTVDPRNRTRLTVPVQRLDPGHYAVEWRVLSRDGHSAVGRFTFRVQTAR